MVEPSGQKPPTGPVARVRATAGALWLWLQCALYARNIPGTLGRVLKMIVTLQFGKLFGKIRALRTSNSALAIYGRPAHAVRTGPPHGVFLGTIDIMSPLGRVPIGAGAGAKPGEQSEVQMVVRIDQPR